MSNSAIRFNGVSKFYKLYRQPKDRLKEALHPFGKNYHEKFFALQDLNLDIGKGEILGIVGKNGSGKSTLLKLICGVLAPTQGSVEVHGKISALLELGAGFNPEFTGLQNIYFYATILGISNELIADRLEQIIDFAEIGEFINQPLKTYSSGMKSRLGFAVAVHIEPEILILDEVLAVGDILFKRKCYGKMEEFFKGGKTIIYVSHDLNSINELCSRAIYLHEGKLLCDGDANSVTTYYQKHLFSKDINAADLNNDPKPEAVMISERDAEIQSGKSAIPEEPSSQDFIPGLQAQMNNVNPEIAVFSEIKIVNQYQQSVNHLKINESYTIQFNITFQKAMQEVSIGAQVRTNKGVIISGANMKNYNNETLPEVLIGERFAVDYQFHCYLLPDTYYIVVFITDNNNHVAICYDAYIFKVKSDGYQMGGYVTLNQKLDIKPLAQ